MNIVSGPVTVKHQLNHLGDVFQKYKLEINSQSKQVTCYEGANTVRGRVLKSELDSYRQIMTGNRPSERKIVITISVHNMVRELQ